jgi:type IV pilus assembly protein PilW
MRAAIRTRRHDDPSQRGFSLVELMVALAIGIFLLAGALTVFQQTRTQYRAIEAVSRLQESARYAMSVLENDLRLAGYWAKHSQSSSVSRVANIPGLPLSLCDPDFDPTPANLQTYVAGGGVVKLDCATNPRAGTDVLIIRRSSVDPVPPELAADEDTVPDLVDGVLYAQNSYVGTLVFEGDSIPTPYFSDTSDTHLLITNAYYVSNGSESDPNLPSLHRVSLAAGPAAQDDEIIQGIESLTIEFGLDTNGDTAVDTWSVDPAALAADPPLAARVTLVARAEQRENTVVPDGFRRFSITKTVYLRNERR